MTASGNVHGVQSHSGTAGTGYRRESTHPGHHHLDLHPRNSRSRAEPADQPRRYRLGCPGGPASHRNPVSWDRHSRSDRARRTMPAGWQCDPGTPGQAG